MEADTVTLPESALLVHRERIFSGKMLMDRVISFNDDKIISALACSACPSEYTYQSTNDDVRGGRNGKEGLSGGG
jgi:hypothetical protein